MSVAPRECSVTTADAAAAGFAAAREVVRLHCDPKEGAAYWIEQCERRGIRPNRLVDWSDLAQFGWMDEAAMRMRPIDDFLPRQARESRSGRLILAETSGFLGEAKTAAFAPEEFRTAFIDPFEPAAVECGFPSTGRWLWLGPSGPHPIGQAARTLGWMRSGRDPYTVDFDPRWFNRLAPGSFARERYLAHLGEQALTILDREPVEIMFATPATLEYLAPRMTEPSRLRVTGIHYGGQAVSTERLEGLRAQFPRAVHLAGYGNSLAGVSMEYRVPGGERPSYFPHGARLRFRLVDPEATAERPPEAWREVEYGERGRVVLNRFDRTMMIVNLLERDEATRLAAPDSLRRLGITGDGVGNPQPAREFQGRTVEGIY